jgi:metal-sulfur cluster biosynthetic enzyme
MPTRDDILNALRNVIDPELGINIVDLGLVYSAEVSDNRVQVVMTMTTPACPMNAYLTERAQNALAEQFDELEDVNVELTWEPPWGPQMMSPAARKQLGW